MGSFIKYFRFACLIMTGVISASQQDATMFLKIAEGFKILKMTSTPSTSSQIYERANVSHFKYLTAGRRMSPAQCM